MTKIFFCTQPPSNTNWLATLRCFSVHSSFVFLRSNARAGSSQIPPLILHIHALLPTSSNRLSWSAVPAFSPRLLMGKHMFSVALEHQGVPMQPHDTQITGLAHHCFCRSSYLSPHLKFSNLFHPSFSLFMVPFSCPGSSCSTLVGKSASTSRPKASMNKRQRSRALFFCCCCQLPPQF